MFRSSGESEKLQFFFALFVDLTLSWRRSLSYRNKSIDMQSKSMDWFLFNWYLRHERVNYIILVLSLRRNISGLLCLEIDLRLINEITFVKASGNYFHKNILS